MKLKIFVIDDEECVRDSFKMYQEDRGHEVLTVVESVLCDVYCGDDCQENFPCGQVLLVDYHMPKMTGLEFIEQMAKRGCKSLPTNKIIMSGNTSAIDLERVKRTGCQAVQKPLTFDELDSIVHKAMEDIN